MRDRAILTRTFFGLLLGVLLAFTDPTGALYAQTCYTAGPDSRLTVSGSAVVRSFSCTSDEIRGQARAGGEPSGPVETELYVPVRSFDCGRREINRDLYEALKADEHPYIRYRVHTTNLLSSSDRRKETVEVIGSLTMAGTTRPDTTRIQGTPVSGEGFRIRGATRLSLRRFGITPPTALFGLVRVQDSVTVSADLVGVPECPDAE